MTTVSELEVRLNGDSSRLERALTAADTRVRGFAGNVATHAATAYRALRAVGIGAAAVGSAAIGFGIEFESSFADVRKTVDGTDEDFAALEATIRRMATDESNPLSALENAQNTLASIMALGGQLGIATDELESFTQTVGLMTVATDMGAESAAFFVGRFANITGIDSSQFDNLADSVVTLGNNMAATESEIAEVAMRLAVLSNMDFDADQILGWSAAIQSLGINPEAGSSAMIQTITELMSVAADGGEDLETLADALGVVGDEFASLLLEDPNEGLQEFLRLYDELGQIERIELLDDMGLDGIRQAQFINVLAGGLDTVTESLSLAEEGWAGNGAAMEEAAAKADTTQGNLNQLANSLRDLGIAFFEFAGPGLNQGIDFLTEAFQGLPDSLNQISNVMANLGDIFTLTLADMGRDFNMWKLGLERGFLDLEFGAIAGLVDRGMEVPEWMVNESIRLNVEVMGVENSQSVDQGLRNQILGGMGINIDAIDLGTTGHTFGENLRTAIENGMQAEFAYGFDEAAQLTIMGALRTALDFGEVEDAGPLMEIGRFIDPTETRALLQSELQEAIETGDEAAFEALASLDITEFILGENTVDLFREQLLATVESEVYTPTVNLSLQAGMIDTSAVQAAVAGQLASVGAGAAGSAAYGQPQGAPVTVNSYGQSPYQLVEQVQSAQRSLGH